jgi:hypothetical protein
MSTSQSSMAPWVLIPIVTVEVATPSTNDGAHRCPRAEQLDRASAACARSSSESLRPSGRRRQPQQAPANSGHALGPKTPQPAHIEPHVAKKRARVRQCAASDAGGRCTSARLCAFGMVTTDERCLGGRGAFHENASSRSVGSSPEVSGKASHRRLRGASDAYTSSGTLNRLHT